MEGKEIYESMEKAAQEIELKKQAILRAVDEFIHEDIRPGDVTINDLMDAKGITRERARKVVIKMNNSPEYKKVTVYDPRAKGLVVAIRPLGGDSESELS